MSNSCISKVVTLSLLLAIILNPSVSAISDPVNSTDQQTARQDMDTGAAIVNLTVANRTFNENVTIVSGATPTPINLRSAVRRDTSVNTTNQSVVNGTKRDVTGNPDRINILTTTPVKKRPTPSPQISNGTKKIAPVPKPIGMTQKEKIAAIVALDHIKRMSVPIKKNTAVSSLTMKETYGSIWKQVPPIPDFSTRLYPSSVVFNDKMWVIGGDDGNCGPYQSDVWYTSDGVTWTQVSGSDALFPRYGHTSVIFNNKIWVIGGSDATGPKNDVWYSNDGMTWIMANGSAGFSPRVYHASVVFHNKIWVIGGDPSADNTDIWSSSDGIQWTQVTNSTEFVLRDGSTCVVFNNRMWVIGGAGEGQYKNDVWYSDNGETWILATGSAGFSPRVDHTSVVYNNRIWVIGGRIEGCLKKDVWYSDDGVTWTQATDSAAFLPRCWHSSIVFNNKIWVIGGDIWLTGDDTDRFGKDIWSSSDGVTWTRPPIPFIFSPRLYHTSVVFNNKLWVIGGADGFSGGHGDVWYSDDGVAWTQATDSAAFGNRQGSAIVVYNNRIWMVGGYTDYFKNDVWSSADGVTWILISNTSPFPCTCFYNAVVFDNKMWVIRDDNAFGGSDQNDIWYSTDGITWTRAVNSAPFDLRHGYASVVFDNKIWVIGGSAFPYKNDVWSSPDGMHWTQVTASAGFSPRVYPKAVVSNNRIWLTGGIDSDGYYLTDVWSSPDGVIWTQETPDAGFPPREGFTLTAFRDKLWVIGGGYWNSNLGERYFNDVWYHEVPPTPPQYSFSITQVGNPGSMGFDDISSAVDLDSTMLSLALEQDSQVTWTPAFWKKETAVTTEDLGTNGRGLNDAIFHYHAGHGAKDLFFLGKTYLALSNGQSIHATDVEGKWGRNNKWVYLDSCNILSDPSWSKALNTTHGMFGYTTPKFTGAKEKTDFIEFAQGRTYPHSAPIPLSKAFYNSTKQNQPPSVTAAVIFGNKDQYDNDYLPGHGSMAADKDPHDHSYFYREWRCNGVERAL